MMVLQLLLPLLALLHTASAAVPADEIDALSLPGYKRAFPHGSRHYSGYIRTYYPGRSVKVYTHYHLALHEDPTAPVLQWQQGGPGGSSLLGLFTENGPLTLNDASWKDDDTLEVFDNPHTWANAAGGVSLLYIEHPAPTGFSYCEPACKHDDESQADLHLAILDEFFGNMYPELRKNRYVISGESYAGVLVPTLAERILKRRSPGANVAPDSLEGFASRTCVEIKFRRPTPSTRRCDGPLNSLVDSTQAGQRLPGQQSVHLYSL
jgi:carboxypeptidase C (cathepsin A)